MTSREIIDLMYERKQLHDKISQHRKEIQEFQDRIDVINEELIHRHPEMGGLCNYLTKDEKDKIIIIMRENYAKLNEKFAEAFINQDSKKCEEVAAEMKIALDKLDIAYNTEIKNPVCR